MLSRNNIIRETYEFAEMHDAAVLSAGVPTKEYTHPYSPGQHDAS